MLTEEQIKNLKKGAPIVIHTTFDHSDSECDIWFHAPGVRFKDNIDYISPAYVSLPTEIVNSQSSIVNKYSPTRLFKTGDKVRVVEWNGRKVHDPMNGSVWTVNRNECNGGIAHESILVSLFYEDDKEGHIIDIPPCYLELVTPVEELEPYYIETETFDYEIRNANNDPDIGTSLAFHIMFQDQDESEILRVKSYYESYVYSSEHAEADAKAELARLNEEWRKEQNNE